MKAEKRGRRTILYMASAFLLLFFIWLGYEGFTGEAEKKVDILFLGDSLIGQYRDETSVPYLVGEYLGKSTYNGAFGGSCLARLGREENKAYQKDELTLIGLARAIAYEDFRAQQAVSIWEPATEHFPQVIDELAQISARDLEYLVLEYGTNDYFGGVPIEAPEKPYDEYTFQGALCSALEILRKYLPNVQIILISPTYNWYLNTQENCENKDFGGGYLAAYVDSIAQTAEKYNIKYLDVYTDFYPTEMGAALEFTSDGVHPNEAGRRLLAEKIAEYIQELEK